MAVTAELAHCVLRALSSIVAIKIQGVLARVLADAVANVDTHALNSP